MNVSPDALRKQTLDVLKEIDSHLKDHSDPYLRASLLLGKSQCLNTLTMLNEQGKK
jgi:hypothetical protein